MLRSTPDGREAVSRCTGAIYGLAILLTSTISVPVAAGDAVEISATGRGNMAILPIYTVRNDFDTLVSLYAGAGHSAVRVRILDREGRLQVAANLYLWEYESHAFALTRAEDGNPALRLAEDMCLLLPNGPLASDGPPLPLDSDVGYIEFIGMGQIDDAVIASAAHSRDCGFLQALWETGEWSTDPGYGLTPPGNFLKVSATLIQTRRATMYSVDATHLRNFTSIVQHTPPGFPTPNLSTAHAPSPDNPALTRSRNCFAQACVVDDWDTPLHAVSAALTTARLFGEYVTSRSINANTEWVMTYPTHPLLEALPELEIIVTSLPRDNRSTDVICIPVPPPRPPDIPCARSFAVQHTAAVNGIDVGYATHYAEETSPPPEQSPTAILGLKNSIQTEHGNMPTAGMAIIHFHPEQTTLANPYSGHAYLGRPVISLVLQEYTNAQLTDPDGGNLIARYGNTFAAGRELRLAD